jgi:hypothetical protein
MPLVRPGKWAYAYSTSGSRFDDFISRYFARSPETLLICGAGFDPRATLIPLALAGACNTIDAWLLREERPSPHVGNRALADDATRLMCSAFRSAKVATFNVFDDDGALAVPDTLFAEIDLSLLDSYTDVVVDFSAVSLGVSFPLTKLLYESAVAGQFPNLHLMVTAAPAVDRAITATYDTAVKSPRGFFPPASADSPAATLWVPQLEQGHADILERIRGEIHADEICPIVPFPTRAVRTAEELFLEFRRFLSSGDGWNVDPRDVIYAAEDSPLDVYRTLVRIARERRQVFEELGTSEVILTPMGSKVVAIGALMAALEENLTVRYVEARNYDAVNVAQSVVQFDKTAIWLVGGPTWEPTA